MTYRNPWYLFGRISTSFTNIGSIKSTSRTFNTSYALSKWPHLHRAYIISRCIFFWLAVSISYCWLGIQRVVAGFYTSAKTISTWPLVTLLQTLDFTVNPLSTKGGWISTPTSKNGIFKNRFLHFFRSNFKIWLNWQRALDNIFHLIYSLYFYGQN